MTGIAPPKVNLQRYLRVYVFALGISLLFLGDRSTYGAEIENRLQQALNLLTQVPTGQSLVKKAQQLWKLSDLSELLEKFKWGEASRTDTILTRHYNPKTGEEDRDREITIYLRKDQSQFELTLDMAHELVHATSRPGFDPYDPTLTPGKYIYAAIEGEGGEVDAVVTECQTGQEMAQLLKVPFRRCERYRKDLGRNELDRDRVRRDFYRVGQWKVDLHNKLKDEFELFPYLSADAPTLYSSTGHAPYPLALLREFQEITEMACDNSRSRMKTAASNKSWIKNSWMKTSFSQRVQTAQDDVEHFLLKRCNN